ncbi:MAG: hypothetical protein ACI93R_003479 [Flavobacteriales bacterium]|jgi:hypothetical protein
MFFCQPYSSQRTLAHVRIQMLLKVVGVLFVLMSSVVSAESLIGQHLFQQSSEDEVDYRVALGSLEKINGQWRTEREVRVSGLVERMSYELSAGVQTIEDALEIIEREYAPSQGRQIFSCSGLECGSSNTWANNRFGIKQLYGLDQTQHYWVFQSTKTENTLDVLYLVQRGNKRVYLHHELIRYSGDIAALLVPDSSLILKTLLAQGYYVVPVLESDEKSFDSVHTQALAEALNKKPFLKFYLVAHNSVTTNSAKAMEQAELMALATEASLVSSGVKQKRIVRIVAGDSMPRLAYPGARIEVVLRR